MQDIQQSLKTYFSEWKTWCEQVSEFDFGSLQSMHVGWKVPDEAALGQKVTELLPEIEQGHIGTVDNRKIILLVPKKPIENVPILQIMQLRPGSTDPLGLDHVAFYCKDIPALQAALETSSYKWEQQSNPGHIWISLWFGDNQREAKFFDHTSLDLGAHELREASEIIKNY